MSCRCCVQKWLSMTRLSGGSRLLLEHLLLVWRPVLIVEVVKVVKVVEVAEVDMAEMGVWEATPITPVTQVLTMEAVGKSLPTGRPGEG